MMVNRLQRLIMISTVWLHKNFREDLIMSFTNKTPNYNLPQWLGTDKPSWLVDVNGAFSSIDAAVKAAADSGSGADATARAALETAQAAQETANGAAEQADNANTKADNANVTAGNAQTAAGEALGKVNAISNVNQWKRYIALSQDDTVVINPGLTKKLSYEWNRQFQRQVLFYNETLKLMQISMYVEVTATEENQSTLQNMFTDNRYPGINLWPLYKLPFDCTGSLAVAFFTTGGNNYQNQSTVMANTVVILSYGGSAWVCGVSDNTTTEKKWSTIELGGFPLWINVAGLGTITLNGWDTL